MLNSKKLVLSLGVVAVFFAYSFQQRHEAKSAVAVEPINTPTQTPATSAEGEVQDDGGQVIAPTPVATVPKASTSGKYKDGAFTGNSADAYYGLIQVKAVVSGGKITDVIFLDHPKDNPTSRYINQQAMPLLKQEAISAQSDQVNIITGATDTSVAFQQSLTSALSQAKP